MAKLTSRLKKKSEKRGDDAYASRHETYGLLAEEVHELLDALHKNEGDNFKEELLDIATVCILGVASHETVYEK